MQKTKIEWVKNPDGSPGYVFNPIKGLCPVGCWYCYARKIYKRFGEQIMGDYEDDDGGSSLDIHTPFLADPTIEKFPKKAARIFVCSTFELFHPVADTWRDQIFEVIEKHPEHTFILLTKLPQHIDREMPENVWLGTTITCVGGDEENADALEDIQAKIKFISLEPLMGEPSAIFQKIKKLNWLIVGRLTGMRHSKYSQGPWPVHYIWLKALVGRARLDGVPIFLKDNLSGIWPGKLIQERPKG